ncbi:hypothetical protein OG21DRAFT_1517866 [Imleria badia]|nr:hypothetical protein OG21DRAFT_1517866 [Imleria badia]
MIPISESINRVHLSLRMTYHPAQEGDTEEDIVIASRGAKLVDLSLGPAYCRFHASSGRIAPTHAVQRDALFIMHRSCLDTFYRVPMLKDKWLVTSIHICPAFLKYLSSEFM